MKIAAFSLISLALVLAACRPSAKTAAQKTYQFTGKVIAVDAKDHTATIDGAAIPGYMDAMKMDYPVPSASDLASMKAGETINATVSVSEDGSYSLSNIHEASK